MNIEWTIKSFWFHKFINRVNDYKTLRRILI